MMIHARVYHKQSPMGALRRVCKTRLTPRCAAGESSSAGSVAKVILKVPKQVNYGQSIAAVGSVPVLGSWDPSCALRLTWTEGDIWTADVDLPTGVDVEYKYVVCHKRDKTRFDWLQGDNLVLSLSGLATTVEVLDAWEGGHQSITARSAEGMAPHAEAPMPEAPAAEPITAAVAMAEEATAPVEDVPVTAYPEEGLQVPGAPLTLEAEDEEHPVPEAVAVVEEAAAASAQAVEAAEKLVAAVEEAPREEVPSAADVEEDITVAVAQAPKEEVEEVVQAVEAVVEAAPEEAEPDLPVMPTLTPKPAPVPQAANILPGPMSTSPAEKKKEKKNGKKKAGLFSFMQKKD